MYMIYFVALNIYIIYFFIMIINDTDFFFFFQAEDGIRDLYVTGSSDVCSSDLRRGTIAVADGDGRAGIVADFARAERRELEEVFRRIRRSAGDPRRELRDDLERAVARILMRIDPVSGESPQHPV